MYFSSVERAKIIKRKGGLRIIALYGGRGDDSYAFLAQVLSKTHGFQTVPRIEKTAQGKPYFPDHPAIQFSLSHSGNYVLIAIGTRPLGVDIECIRPRAEKLPQYALTAAEFEIFLEQGGDWAAFYHLWTKKEAFVKYTGEGLGKGMRKELPTDGVRFFSYCGSDYRAALCCEEAAPEEIIWLDAEIQEGFHG